MLKSIKINGYEITCDKKCGYGEVISTKEIKTNLGNELKDREWFIEKGLHICPNCR